MPKYEVDVTFSVIIEAPNVAQAHWVADTMVRSNAPDCGTTSRGRDRIAYVIEKTGKRVGLPRRVLRGN